MTLQRAQLLYVEAQRLALAPKRIDPREQRIVEMNFGLMRGKERRDIAFNRLDVFVRIGAGEIEKDARDAAEKLPGALQRDDRILERRRRRIIRDGGDLGFMRRERLREGGGKSSGLIAANGAKPNGPAQSSSRGFWVSCVIGHPN